MGKRLAVAAMDAAVTNPSRLGSYPVKYPYRRSNQLATRNTLMASIIDDSAPMEMFYYRLQMAPSDCRNLQSIPSSDFHIRTNQWWF